MNITPLSNCMIDYSKRLSKCETLTDLNALLDEFAMLVQDAIKQKPSTEIEFDEFREGLLHENRGEFAGYEFMKRYGSIMLPEVMFITQMFAVELKSPWGAMFMRLVEVGRIAQNSDGNYVVR